MDYRLELINEDDFENLVNVICQKILGMGVVNFSKGKDGGRDGKFEGTANRFPSEACPWAGKIIVQAKHTSISTASTSDNDFKQKIELEIAKIIQLRENGDIDCYLLFTNRKHPGVKGEELLKDIKTRTVLDKVVIIGKETINNLYLNQNRDIVKQFGLDKLHIPFDFSDDEIKDIILEFRQQLPLIKDDLKTEVNKIKYNFDLIAIDKKNEKNGLGEEYFKTEIQSKSLMDFDKIQTFLNSPKNEEVKNYYFDIASELSNLIQIRRDDFRAFEEIFVFIYQKICDGCTMLKGSKRHVFTFLHYMYSECLIGKK